MTKKLDNKFISDNCKRKTDELFDPKKNTTEYENLFEQVYDIPKIKKPAIKVYGSRLDNPSIPNAFVTSIRKLKKFK